MFLIGWEFYENIHVKLITLLSISSIFICSHQAMAASCGALRDSGLNATNTSSMSLNDGGNGHTFAKGTNVIKIDGDYWKWCYTANDDYRCRISSKTGTHDPNATFPKYVYSYDNHYANTCGENHEYHIEYRKYDDCSNNGYRCVKNTIECIADNHVTSAGGLYEHHTDFGFDTKFGNNNAIYLSSVFQKNGDAYVNNRTVYMAYSIGVGDGTATWTKRNTSEINSGYPSTRAQHAAYGYDTKGCDRKITNVKWAQNHCENGTVYIKTEARGDVTRGFYLYYKTSTDDLLYDCGTCSDGRVLSAGSTVSVGGSSITLHNCDSCNAAAYFEVVDGGDCGCMRGFTRNGGSCECNPADNREIVNNNKCLCKKGYKDNGNDTTGACVRAAHFNFDYLDENGDPVCETGFTPDYAQSNYAQRYWCGVATYDSSNPGTMCKTSDGFHYDSSANACKCSEPFFTPYPNSNDVPANTHNTQDDFCAPDGDTVYFDDTGWFTVKKDLTSGTPPEQCLVNGGQWWAQ